LIIETAGAENDVLKLLPPLTISHEELEDGICRLENSLKTTLRKLA